MENTFEGTKKGIRFRYWINYWKNLRCVIFGHSAIKGVDDSGYCICERCESHSYYDYISWQPKWFDRVRTCLVGWSLPVKCYKCDKASWKVFWKDRHSICPRCNEDDLPF